MDVIILQRDLRLLDNPALFYGSIKGNYCVIYVYDENYHLFHSMNGFDYKEEFFCHPSSDVAKQAF